MLQRWNTALFWPVHVGSLSDEGGSPIHWLFRDFTYTFRLMEAPVVPAGLSPSDCQAPAIHTPLRRVHPLAGVTLS